MLLFLSTPPVSRMVPSSSVVAASKMREDTMLVGHCPLTGVPTHEKVPEAGSYRSAVARAAPDCPESLLPPAISTCPAFAPVVRKIGRMQMPVRFHWCVGRGEGGRAAERQDLSCNVVLRATCDENDIVVRVSTDMIASGSAGT